MPSRTRTEHRAKKSLGQHFLTNPSVIQRIVDRARELSLDQSVEFKTLLEIGPGRGALTESWNKWKTNGWVDRILLVEKDNELAQMWREDSDFEVIEGDFLEVDISSSLDKESVLVVSNLPYSSATAILTELNRMRRQIPAMILMFQKEVADRLKAEIGTGEFHKETGSLTIWIQNFWEVERLCRAAATSFRPPPKVDSEVLTFIRRTEPQIRGSEENDLRLERLLKSAFQQKRKTLKNNLHHPPWSEALIASNVDSGLRAEALNWDQWNALFGALLEEDKR